jgi:lipid-binding SYLF domain-containing protein
MIRMTCALMGVCVMIGAMVGCSTLPPAAADRPGLEADARRTVATATKLDPTLQAFVDNSAGYVVFPSVAKGGVGVGGAHGKGVVFQKGRLVGYCELTQASIGLQLGGQSFSELVFLETPAALQRFESGEFAIAAQATAVALKSGAAANANYSDSVSVFTLDESGLMGEAAIGGQRFRYVPAEQGSGSMTPEQQTGW